MRSIAGRRGGEAHATIEHETCKGRVLVAEDDPRLARQVGAHLTRSGWSVEVVHDGEAALRLARAEPFTALLLDLRLPVYDGLQVLEALRAEGAAPAAILLSGFLDVETTLQALGAGAHEVLEKPVAPQHLLEILDGIAADIQPPVSPPTADAWVGTTAAAQQVREQIALAGSYAQVPVLIAGETGTGKELVARAIHRLMGASTPMVALNCAAIPEELFESELFGHEAGAFTGSRGARQGLIEAAGGGVIFFDEVGEMPASQQAKLLRVLETRTYRRVGGTRALPMAARVVSATNRRLRGGSREALRADLFYRLAGYTIRTPALRERLADLELLATHLLAQMHERHPNLPRAISPEAITALRSHDWPGNVRELRAVVQSAALRARGDVLGVQAAVEALRDRGCLDTKGPRHQSGIRHKVPVVVELAPPDARLSMDLPAMERDAITRAYAECEGNLSRCARQLGIPRSTLRDKLRRFGLR